MTLNYDGSRSSQGRRSWCQLLAHG